MVSEKKTFICFSFCKPMGDDYAPGGGQVGPQCHDLQDLFRGLLNIASHKT